MGGHAIESPIQLRDDLTHSLGSTNRRRDDVLGSPLAILPQIPRWTIHGLLGGRDVMDYESLHDTKVVTDDLGQLVVKEALLTIFRELASLSWFTPFTNMGISTEGVEIVTPFHMNPSLLQGSEDPSGLPNLFSTSIAPFDVSGVSLLEDGDGLSIGDKLPVLSLDCAFQLAMGRITLEHVDHAAEVNEGVIDGDNIHFVRVCSPGDQAPNTDKSIHSDLYHRVSGLRLALHGKTWLSVEQEDQRASPFSFYSFSPLVRVIIFMDLKSIL